MPLFTGHEDYDAEELYCMLGGDAVQLYRSRRYTTRVKAALHECELIAFRQEGAGS